MISRGWTMIDDESLYEDGEPLDCESTRYQVIKERCDELAQEWSAIETAREERLFSRPDNPWEFDPEEEFIAEMIEEHGPEWLDSYNKGKEVATEKETLRRAEIEALLRSYGARMMRPHEHYNEEEQYMDYMESRYDNRGW